MSDSSTLLPLAAAAGGGFIDGLPASQLVAAGFTLLQRNAPLVRVLRGRRSALLLNSGPQFLTALAASDGHGAVLINPLAAPAEVAHQIADADVAVVFTSRGLMSKLPPGVPFVLLDNAPRSATSHFAGGDTEVDLGSHVGLSVEVDSTAAGRDEEAAIVYTSAMAGRPLGAVLTHHNLLANARQTVAALGYTAGGHCLAALPFAHLFGFTVTLIAPMISGSRVTTMARFNPLVAVELLRTGGITEFFGVPAVFAAMLTAIERTGGSLASPSLRLSGCGGAVLTRDIQERWFDATGLELRQGYGLTEASPVCLFNRVSMPNQRGTLGVAFPGCEVSIRDPELHTELPDGSAGEICIRGETVFRGYVRDGDSGLLVRDGWLGSGDRGVKDANGTVTFLGLIKNMFTRNGFNVYPKEIERVVSEMPDVRSVNCYAIPEPSRENDVGIVVSGRVTEGDVRLWCESRLAVYKQPSVIRLVA